MLVAASRGYRIWHWFEDRKEGTLVGQRVKQRLNERHINTSRVQQEISIVTFFHFPSLKCVLVTLFPTKYTETSI